MTNKCEICVGDFCNGCNPPDYPFFERKYNVDPIAWDIVNTWLEWHDPPAAEEFEFDEEWDRFMNGE